MKEKIEEIIDKKFETCWVDKRSAIAHVHKDRIEELKSELNTELQKAVEEAVRGFADVVYESFRNHDLKIHALIEEYLESEGKE